MNTDEDLVEFIVRTERSLFRTHQDIGANPNALLVWNHVRGFVGLPALTRVDLARRARETYANDAMKAMLRNDQAAVERYRSAWAELDAVVDAPDPEQALADYDEQIRKAQRVG